MRRILLGFVVTTFLAVGLHPAPVSAKKCIDVFKPFYDCERKDEDGDESNPTLEFTAPVGPSEDFIIDFNSNIYQCMCQAGGSFKNPKFRDSKSFLCGTKGSLNGDFFDAVSGRVSGKKVKMGQILFDVEGGEARVFECIEGVAPVASE